MARLGAGGALGQGFRLQDTCEEVVRIQVGDTKSGGFGKLLVAFGDGLNREVGWGLGNWRATNNAAVELERVRRWFWDAKEQGVWVGLPFMTQA